MSSQALTEKNSSNVVEINQYDALISKALSSDVDIDKLQKLMEMKERWEESESKKQFIKSMASFKSECPTIIKTQQGHNYKYADLGLIIESISPVLAKHDLSLSFDMKQDLTNNGMVITVYCKITHIQGHSESVPMSSLPDDGGKMNSIQRIASAVTYLKRHTLSAITGLSIISEDDDGKNATSESATVLINEDQASKIQTLFEETKQPKEPVFKWINNAYGLQVTQIEEIPAKHYAEFYNTLKIKGGQNG